MMRGFRLDLSATQDDELGMLTFSNHIDQQMKCGRQQFTIFVITFGVAHRRDSWYRNTGDTASLKDAR